MSAYIIVDVEITNPEAYAEYVKMVPATLEAYGGEFVVRGGKAENLEGDWMPKRVVVARFDSMERAKGWWNSEIYVEPKKLRQSAAITNMIVVEGV